MIVVVALLACTDAEAPVAEALPGVWSPEELDRLASLRLDPTPRPDPTNRYADDPGAARLGQQLFYDAGLSPSGAVACVTCHRPDAMFGDTTPLSKGVGTTGRHTPSIVGNQYGAWFFWDGRADSLWSQALGPLENPDEMGSDRVYVARYVLEHDGDAYAQVFGERPDLSDRTRFPDHAKPGNDRPDLDRAWRAMAAEDRAVVDRVFANVGKAFAAYERRLAPEPAPFDRYVDAVLAGDPTGGGLLDDAQIRGLSLFLRDADCVTCHHGPMFTDRSFHNLGVPEAAKGYDPGRQSGAGLVAGGEFNCRSPHSDTADCPELRYLNPTFPDFQAAFKTPTLRYVTETAPYMHNGEMATLDDVMRFYDELPGTPPAGHRELTLEPLQLSDEEVADVVAFLGALTGDPLPAELIGVPAPETAEADR